MGHLISLIVGLGVGGCYAILGVRSPAPPFVALIGLLGMLAGEHGTRALLSRLQPSSSPASSVSAAGNDGEHGPQPRGGPEPR